MKPGTLYGVGVGPGDPELITLKAVKVLNHVKVIFAASSSKNEYSLALENAKSHMLNGAEVVRLSFPMTRDQEILEKAWEENATRILDFVQQGKDVAFITIGDPLTYSTFGYVMETIQEMAPEVPVCVIPGVTSYQAATAAAGHFGVNRNDSDAGPPQENLCGAPVDQHRAERDWRGVPAGDGVRGLGAHSVLFLFQFGCKRVVIGIEWGHHSPCYREKRGMKELPSPANTTNGSPLNLCRWFGHERIGFYEE